MLALVEHLRAARTNEHTLYPAWPAQAPAMRAWLGDEVGRLREGLPRARTTVAALRSRAMGSEAERNAALRAHVRYPKLEVLRSKLAWQQRAQDAREGIAPVEPFALDSALGDKNAKELNELAWPLVDPDRTSFGREAEGLALARLGHGKASGRGLARLGDTLAWALFGSGLDDEALSASRTAIDVARRDERKEYEGYLAKLKQAIAPARQSGRAAVETLARQVSHLEAELTDWRFDQESERFLHETLSRVVREIEAFEQDEVMAVERRLAWSERVEELTIRRFAARWDEAKRAIAVADGEVASALYAGDPVDLAPQIGLVPIGMNPRTLLWEFYHLRSAWNPDAGTDAADLTIPTHREDGSIEVTGDTGIVFVLLPGGTFSMGAQSGDPSAPNHDPLAYDDESPVHGVTLAPFFLARHEVTQGQWLRLTGADNPSQYRPGWGNVTLAHPVEQVDWPTSDRVTRRHQLLLPTEAQWEYGCRASTTTPWWTGVDRESLVLEGIAANLADQAASRDGATFPAIADWPELDDGWVVHAPVDALRPNAWGLFHVHGNLWEWCRDALGGYGVSARAGDGLRQVQAGSSSSRVYRGGGFGNPARNARSAYRGRNAPTIRDYYLGLRVSRARY